MTWFVDNWGNLASLLGLGLSIWAVFAARSANARLAAFERHEVALAMFGEVARCRAEVRELRRSTAKVWPRSRCDMLGDPLAALLARPLWLTEEEREELRRVQKELNRGEIDNDAAAAGRLRSLTASLAKMEARFQTAARTEAQP